jgi:hypothetical protein
LTIMAAAIPFVVPLLPLAVPRLGRGFKRIATKYAPSKVAPVKPVTNTEPFKGKFPERDVTGASVIQVRPPRVSDDVCLASRKSSPPSPRPRRRPIRNVGENIFSCSN